MLFRIGSLTLVRVKGAYAIRMRGAALIVIIGLGVLGYNHLPQLNVFLAKAVLGALGAFGGYWVDRSAFPYARPHEIMGEMDKVKSAAVSDPTLLFLLVATYIRRAIVMGSFMVSMAMAL